MNPLKWRPNTILISFDPANATGNFYDNSSILDFGASLIWKLGTFTGFCDSSSLPCQNFSSEPPSIADNWNYNGASIQYCLVETGGNIKGLTEMCYLQCAPSMMLGTY